MPSAGELGQQGAAGDQHGTAVGSGQQRHHLIGVTGIVQYHQHATVHQEGPVERGPLDEAVRDRAAGDRERAQGFGQHQSGVPRFVRCRREVEVELPVREAGTRQPSGVRHQTGLAHTGPAHDDGHQRPLRRGLVEQSRDLVQRVGPAHEVRYVEGQLTHGQDHDRAGHRDLVLGCC